MIRKTKKEKHLDLETMVSVENEERRRNIEFYAE